MQVTFNLPFEDFDYEVALPKYNLTATRPTPRQLRVDGTENDIEKFEIDFEGITRNADNFAGYHPEQSKAERQRRGA